MIERCWQFMFCFCIWSLWCWITMIVLFIHCDQIMHLKSHILGRYGNGTSSARNKNPKPHINTKYPPKHSWATQFCFLLFFLGGGEHFGYFLHFDLLFPWGQDKIVKIKAQPQNTFFGFQNFLRSTLNAANISAYHTEEFSEPQLHSGYKSVWRVAFNNKGKALCQTRQKLTMWMFRKLLYCHARSLS